MVDIELPKTPAEVSAEALFRHHVVTIVLGLVALGYSHAHAVETAVESKHFTETGQLRPVRRRTLYRWLKAFDTSGISGLEPVERVVASKAISGELLDFLQKQKSADPDASIPELLRRARERKVPGADRPVDRTTAYRAARRLGLSLTCRAAKSQTDMRRYATPHRMSILLVDGKHFRAGPGRLKRVAFFFLDDCTRRVLAVAVGPSESTALLLRGLFAVICHFGVMDLIYFDRGPGFISKDTHAVCRQLSIHYLHGRARYPEGHGKIEAFNKTAHHDVLRGLARADVDPAFGSLELRLHHYLEHDYHVRPHESLGMSPLMRWNQDERPLRFPRDHQDLRSRFVLTESRRVTGDNIVSVDGVHYEMPIGHAHGMVSVQQQMLDNTVWTMHQGKLVRLHPVDLARNAESRRASFASPNIDSSVQAPITAAAMAFERDFGPVPCDTAPLSVDPGRSTAPAAAKTPFR